MSTHVLRIVEAFYAVELPEADWLSGLCEAAQPLLDDGFGVNASTFDLSELGAGNLRLATLGMSEALVSATHRLRVPLAEMRRMFLGGSPVVSLVERADANVTASAAWREVREVHGAADMLAVIGSDADGVGVALGAHRRSAVRLSTRERQQWERIASHAAAAFRLRRRLAAKAALQEPVRARLDGVDVTLSPTGQIATPPGAAPSDLRASALAVESGGATAERAGAHWSALVEGRWAVVDKFESGGRRFLIAHRGRAVDGKTGLTARERAVLAYRARGCSLKLIAAELGRTVSMVARDIDRGMSKLGLRGQSDLSQLFGAGSCT